MKIRLFVPDNLETKQQIQLDLKQSHYLSKVLRCNLNDEVFVFNNKDGEFTAEIIKLGKQIELFIKDKIRAYHKPKNIILAFAPAKTVKPEHIALKATELNLHTIIPIITERTIVRKINPERVTQNIIEAAKQCDSVYVPQLSDAISLSKFLKNLNDNDILIFCDETRAGKRAPELFSQLKYDASKNYIILIGPEGGFSPQEKELITNIHNCHNLCLSDNILRVDTAIIAAASLINSFFVN